MPVERPYERQVTPQATQGRPMRSAASYGAGVGDAVARAGETLQRDRLRANELDRQRTRDQEAIDAQRRLAAIRENMDGVSRELRDNAGPGAAGHAAAIAKAYEAHRESFLDGITEESVRDRALLQFEEFGERLRGNEAQWEDGKRIAKTVTDVKETMAIAANRARRLHDPKAYADELKFGFETIDALTGIDADTRDGLKRDHEQAVTVGYVNGLNDTNPALAKEMLDKGLFEGILDPRQVDALRSGAEVEIRRVEAAAEHEANVAKAAATEEIATIKVQAANGIEVDGERLERAIGLAQVAGDTSNVEELTAIRADNALAKIYERVPPVQRQQREAALAAKAKPSEAEQRELAWLQRSRASLDSRFRNDPAGALASAGGMPALDLEDPASVASRVEWARVQTRATGLPVPVLTKAEADQLGAAYASGYQGKLAVMDQLAALPGREAQAAARMVAPGDAQFQHIVTLREPVRKLAIEGRGALKADRQMLSPAATSYKGDPDDVDLFADQDRAFNNVLRILPGEQRRAIAATAMEIFAGAVDAGDPLNAKTRWKALNLALGSRGLGAEQRGGLATIGDHVTLLPENATVGEFTAGIRNSVAAAKGAAAPVNPDGSPADFRRLHPVMVGAGVYAFHSDRGRAVMRKDGKPFLYRAPAK